MALGDSIFQKVLALDCCRPTSFRGQSSPCPSIILLKLASVCPWRTKVKIIVLLRVVITVLVEILVVVLFLVA